MSKKNTAKKITVYTLLLAMLALPTMVSCSDNTDTKKGVVDTTNTVETQAADTQEQRIMPVLPNEKYDGYEFKIMTAFAGGKDWDEWLPRDIGATEENGDVINDAVFARNSKVEELFNIKISEVSSKDVAGDIKKSVLAGDKSFDVACPRIEQIRNTAQEGYLVNLFNVPNMDLTKPWYDQNAVKELSICNKLFFLTGDLMIADNDATTIFIYNKKMLEDLDLESPYDLVRKKEWTFDKVIEMMKDTPEDINGNSKVDTEDKFGLICQRDSVPSFLVGAGGRIATKNSDDIPELSLITERNVDVLNKVFDLMYDKERVVNLHHSEGKTDIYVMQQKMFKENRALFMWIRMRVVESLRDMEANFGILPIPMYDSKQENYASAVNKYCGTAFCIPNTADNLARTGAIVEALSAESKYTLQEAYYDVNLGTKFIRDDGSEEMLDIILSNRVYDNGDIYNYGNLGGDIMTLSMTNSRELSSFYAKHEKAALKELNNMVEKYQALD